MEPILIILLILLIAMVVSLFSGKETDIHGNIIDENNIDLSDEAESLKEDIEQNEPELLSGEFQVSHCPHCNHKINKDVQFCKKCGGKLIPQKKICPQCDKIYDSESDYCEDDGSKLNNNTINLKNPPKEKSSNKLSLGRKIQTIGKTKLFSIYENGFTYKSIKEELTILWNDVKAIEYDIYIDRIAPGTIMPFIVKSTGTGVEKLSIYISYTTNPPTNIFPEYLSIQFNSLNYFKLLKFNLGSFKRIITQLDIIKLKYNIKDDVSSEFNDFISDLNS